MSLFIIIMNIFLKVNKAPFLIAYIILFPFSSYLWRGRPCQAYKSIRTYMLINFFPYYFATTMQALFPKLKG